MKHYGTVLRIISLCENQKISESTLRRLIHEELVDVFKEGRKLTKELSVEAMLEALEASKK